MNALAAYEFDNEPVRVVMIAGEPWFAAADVAKSLGYDIAPHMLRLLDDDEKGIHKVDTLGGAQEMGIISESGLYHAALKRRGQHAQRFRRWVTQEVLPSIRKTGGYQLHEPPPAAPLLQLESAKISAWVGILREARRIYGTQTARELWVHLGLPVSIAEAQADDPLFGPLRHWLAGRHAATLMESCAGVGLGRPTAAQADRVKRMLTMLGWSHKPVYDGSAKRTMWFGPDQPAAIDAGEPA